MQHLMLQYNIILQCYNSTKLDSATITFVTVQPAQQQLAQYDRVEH